MGVVVMDITYIEVNGVSKKIKENKVLDNISFSIERGKIIGFRGKNGSGKTMLFRALSGLIRIDEGEIKIDGKVMGKDIDFPESLGIVIEYPGLLPGYTGFENLKILADLKGIIGEDKIKEAIKAVGLDPEDKRKFKKYSLGMKQRLGIAQAIMEKPDLIILDEPTNALDQEGVELVKNILIELKNQGKTILVASHDKEEIEYLSDEIYSLEKGRIYNYRIIKG